jgi:hypothetical protein
MKKFLICNPWVIVFATLPIVGCASGYQYNSYGRLLKDHIKQQNVPNHYWCGIALTIETFEFGNNLEQTSGEYYHSNWIRKYEKGAPWMQCISATRGEALQTERWKNVIDSCEKNNKRKCQIAFIRPSNLESEETFQFFALIRSDLERLSALRREQEEKEKADAANKAKQVAETQRQETCDSFGFKRGTDAHTKCQFELYKLEVSTQQNQELRDILNNASAQQNAIQQQILEEQRFESGMRLLQQSADMLNAPSPTVTCKFNNITQTAVCR